MKYALDLIVPVYNEKEIFPVFYDTVSRKVKSDWRMLVVYDFPEDTTLAAAGPIALKDTRVVLIHNATRGVAGAIKTGIANATRVAAMITAVDLPDDVAKIDEMLKLLHEKKAVIVSPSRYMKGGKRLAGRFVNRTLSRLASLSLYYLAGIPIHDATNGSKLYRTSFLKSVTIESTAGWDIALELTVKAHIARGIMIEIPTTQSERTVGASKFKVLKWLPRYLHWYFVALKNHFYRNKKS